MTDQSEADIRWHGRVDQIVGWLLEHADEIDEQDNVRLEIYLFEKKVSIRFAPLVKLES